MMSTRLAVPCTVNQDWALAVACCPTASITDGLGSQELALEVALLNKLLYKNTNQHRGTPYFCRLIEVKRLLGLLKELQLPSMIDDLLQSLEKARTAPPSQPSATLLLQEGAEQRLLPTHESCTLALRRLQAACHLVEQLVPAIHKASLQLLAQLAHSFFMPFCLACLGALARIRVLSCHLFLGVIRAYNAIIEVAPLLPVTTRMAHMSAGAAAAAAPQDLSQATPAGLAAQLPQMLRCEWQGGLPELSCLPFPPGDSLTAQTAAAATRYGIKLLQHVAALGPAAAGQAQQPRTLAAAAAPLEVLEDRGIPCSREALAGGRQDGRAAPGAGAGLRVVEDRGVPVLRQPSQHEEAAQPVTRQAAATEQPGEPAAGGGAAGLEQASRQPLGGSLPAVQVPALPAVRPPPAFVSVLAGTGNGTAAMAKTLRPRPAFISVVAGSAANGPPGPAQAPAQAAAVAARGPSAAVPAVSSAAQPAVASLQDRQSLQHAREVEGPEEALLVSSAAQPAVASQQAQQASSHLRFQHPGGKEGAQEPPAMPPSGALPLAVGAGMGPGVTSAVLSLPHSGQPLPIRPGFNFEQQLQQPQLQPSSQAATGPQQQEISTTTHLHEAGQPGGEALPGVLVSAAEAAAEPAASGADVAAAPAVPGLGEVEMLEAAGGVPLASLDPKVFVGPAEDGGASNSEQQQEQSQEPEQMLWFGREEGAVTVGEGATGGFRAQALRPAEAGAATFRCLQQQPQQAAPPLLPPPPPPAQQQQQQQQDGDHTIDDTNDLELHKGITAAEQPVALPGAIPGLEDGGAIVVLGAVSLPSGEQQGRVPEGLPPWQPNPTNSAPGLAVGLAPRATSAAAAAATSPAAAAAAKVENAADMPRADPGQQHHPRPQQPAAALLLSVGLAGRKRKQSGAIATGLGLPDETAAAAPPSKSWEEWLSPAAGPGTQAPTVGPGATPGSKGNAAVGSQAAAGRSRGRGGRGRGDRATSSSSGHKQGGRGGIGGSAGSGGSSRGRGSPGRGGGRGGAAGGGGSGRWRDSPGRDGGRGSPAGRRGSGGDGRDNGAPRGRGRGQGGRGGLMDTLLSGFQTPKLRRTTQ